MDPFVTNRYLAFVVVTAAQIFLIYRLWHLTNRSRRTMLLAYLLVALAQSATAIWLSASRAYPGQPYTAAQEAAAYFTFSMKALEWPLCFGAIHESLNAYLTPYRALQSVGQKLFRTGMGLAALVILASALIAPQEVFAALTYLRRFEPVLIYGSATVLCLGVAAFVWHFQLRGSSNDEVAFLTIGLIFGQFALVWTAQHFFGSPETRPYWGVARVAIAAPILITAGLRLSAAGDVLHAPAMSGTSPDVRLALEKLNAVLERGVRS